MKKVIVAILFGVAVLFSTMLIKVVTFTSKQIETDLITNIKVDKQQVAFNLSRLIQCKTISAQEKSNFDPAEFVEFHQILEKSFPRIHNNLKKTVVNNFSLLYTWNGRDKSLKPIVLLAHIDVVPISSGTEKDWTYPPFSGQIADNYVWGRGGLDDKGCLVAIMEAVEALLADGYTPQRTLYLAFGHDEEILGDQGAAHIAALLKSRNIEAEWILDEGAFIGIDLFPSVTQPVSMIGIAEKGYVTLELTAEQEGGHSSMPPPHSAIGILSSAIHHLQENPFPAKLEGPSMQLFEFVGPEMPFGMKFLFANKWLFEFLIKSEVEKTNSGNATIRTTIAPTIFHAGTKENVLPQKAMAKVNFRLYPGDSIEEVIEQVKKIVNDPRVHIKLTSQGAREASSVSDIHSESFKLIQRTISQVFPDTIVAPCLVVGSTDTTHYQEISKNTYRFLPIRFTSKDFARLHGTDERINMDSLEEMIKFYIQLIRNSNKGQGIL
jgi:carboxypeptidase PM20D1